MILSEILLRKRYLNNKLKTIDKYIQHINSLDCASSELHTNAIHYKFELLSKIRSHNILIENLNRDTYICVSDTELSVFEALYLLRTLEEKMQTFTDMIESTAAMSVDIYSLFSKNDSLFEEYQRIYLAVLQSDLITKWEG